MVRWDPWTAADSRSIWGGQGQAPDMLRDHGLWMTHCNLLLIWMVYTYNLESVMQQLVYIRMFPHPYRDDWTMMFICKFGHFSKKNNILHFK
jgi:hypothetical protein